MALSEQELDKIQENIKTVMEELFDKNQTFVTEIKTLLEKGKSELEDPDAWLSIEIRTKNSGRISITGEVDRGFLDIKKTRKTLSYNFPRDPASMDLVKKWTPDEEDHIRALSIGLRLVQGVKFLALSNQGFTIEPVSWPLYSLTYKGTLAGASSNMLGIAEAIAITIKEHRPDDFNVRMLRFVKAVDKALKEFE